MAAVLHDTIAFDATQFPPPSANHVTIGEMNAALVHIIDNQDPAIQKFKDARGSLYPILELPKSKGPPTKRPRPPPPSLLDRLSPYLPPTLQTEIRKQIQTLELEKHYKTVMNHVGKVQQQLVPIFYTLTGKPKNLFYGQQIEFELSKQIARTQAWHPHQQVLAMVHQDNRIWIYHVGVSKWYPCGLKNEELQQGVTCLGWKPMSGTILAVGCTEGVLLWHVPSVVNDGASAMLSISKNSKDLLALSSSVSLLSPSSSSKPENQDETSQEGNGLLLSVLRYPNFGNVTAVSWDPRGERLAVASGDSGKVIVWDIATEHGTALDSFHVGVTALSWSPMGDFLLVGYLAKEFGLYRTSDWSFESYQGLLAPVQTVCWTSNGHNIIFSEQGSDTVNCLHVERRGGREDGQQNIAFIPMDSIRYRRNRSAIPLPDISSMLDSLSSDSNNGSRGGGSTTTKTVDFGGEIQELTVDPKFGERLVIRFKESELLASLIVKPTGKMIKDLDLVLPNGLIRGPGWGIERQKMKKAPETSRQEPLPISVAFANGFDKGALLSTIWESGRVSFTPFYFEPSK